MDSTSYLDPIQLQVQITHMKKNLTEENSAYEELKKKIYEEILNADCLQGDTADALKSFHEDFFQLLELVVLANEMDIADAEKVIVELESVESPLEDATEELDGFFIITSLEDAKCKETMYNQLADEYIRSADECGILEGILEAAYRHEAEEYRRKSEIERERKEMYQAKVNRYDRIEENTKGCFMESVELRRLAKNTLDGFAAAFLDGEYQPDRMNLYRQSIQEYFVNYTNSYFQTESESYGLERGAELLEKYLCSQVNEEGKCIYENDVERIIAEIKEYCPCVLTTLYATACFDTSGYARALDRARQVANVAASGYMLQIEKYVENLTVLEFDDLGTNRPRDVEVLQYFARRLMWAGFKPAFVAGILGNMIYEGNIGQLENSAYGSNKPSYLVNMDNALKEDCDFDCDYNTYSKQYITEIGISEIQRLLNAAINYNTKYGLDFNDSAKFGLGSIQWTSPERVSGLLASYRNVCGDGNDFPTMEQCMEAEADFMIGELRGDYDSVGVNYGEIYIDWLEENVDMDDPQTAYNACYSLCVGYIVPSNDEWEIRSTVGEKIYEIMMGEVQ